VIEKKSELNLRRNLNFFCINFFISAPVLYAWYSKLLPSIHTALFPNASKFASSIYRMLIDQLLFTPLLYCGFYPILQMVSDRDWRSFGKGVQKVREKLWETLVNNWKIWPLAITINFRFVPVKYHVPFVNSVGVLWNMILSHIASK
jgi:hypothetical protein